MIDKNLNTKKNKNLPPSDLPAEALAKEGWVETTLGEVIFPVSETFNFKGKEKVHFLNTGDILEGKLLHKNLSNVSSLPGQAKKTFKLNDILFSEIRPANKRYMFVNFDSLNSVASTKLMVLRGKENIDMNFIYKLITSNYTLQEFQIIAESRSGTFPQITFEAVANFPIILPPLPEQKAIASVLSAFDDKIELLREENKTLEDIGKAVYKEWFGKYSVEKPEELPRGWRVGKLGELVLDSIGGDYGKETQDNIFNTETLCLRGTDLPDMKNNIPNRAPIRFVRDSKLKKCKLLNGDIVIEISGGTEGQSTGRSIYINDEIINRSNLPITSVNFCRIIRPKKIEFSYFIYSCLDHLYNLGIFFNLENGSTGIKNLNLKFLLNDFEIILPNEEDVLDFDLRIKGVFEKIQYNNSQIQSLARSRDELLPKLMSGQIRVNGFNKS